MRRLIYPMREQYEEYLIDESKFSGYADSISFPESEEEIQEVLRELEAAHIPVTIQGGKTGITGAAVPEGGHVMNLSHMNKVKGSRLLEDGTGRITVEPGINLIDLEKAIVAASARRPSSGRQTRRRLQPPSEGLRRPMRKVSAGCCMDLPGSISSLSGW